MRSSYSPGMSASRMGRRGAEAYRATLPYPSYALDLSCSNDLARISSGDEVRIASGSYLEDQHNRLTILGLAHSYLGSEGDYERDYGYDRGSVQAAPRSGQQEMGDFVKIAEAPHRAPITKVAWEPSSSSGFASPSSSRAREREYLATTGDYLRLWELGGGDGGGDGTSAGSGGYVGRQAPWKGDRLVEYAFFKNSKTDRPPPITSMSWNTIDPTLLLTSSIDTTCTLWSIPNLTAKTQLIAHDKEVYDVAWMPGSVDAFASVGADGSVRLFDLRSLEHSTICYEAGVPAAPGLIPGSNLAGEPGLGTSPPLLRLAFHSSNPDYLATFHNDDSCVQILDLRQPGQAVAVLSGHRAPVNALAWAPAGFAGLPSHGSPLAQRPSSKGYPFSPEPTGPSSSNMLCSVADDGQALVWDLDKGSHPSSGISSLHRSLGRSLAKGVSREPVLAYNAQEEINNVCWKGDTIGLCWGRHIEVIKI